MFKIVLLCLFFLSLVVVPIVLVGTKKDITMDKDPTFHHAEGQPINSKDSHAMAKKIGAYAYLECSAKLNDGVLQVLDIALKAILESVAPPTEYDKMDSHSMVIIMYSLHILRLYFLLAHGILYVHIDLRGVNINVQSSKHLRLVVYNIQTA